MFRGLAFRLCVFGLVTHVSQLASCNAEEHFEFGNGGGIVGLAMTRTVQTELGIATDEDLLKQLRQISDDQARELQNTFRKLPPKNRKDRRDDLQRTAWSIRNRERPELRKVLGEARYERLRQIYLQDLGPGIALEPDVMNAIELTEPQITQLEALRVECQNRTPPIDEKELSRRIDDTLSEAQRSKLVAIKGEPFDRASIDRPKPNRPVALHPAGMAGLALMGPVQAELGLQAGSTNVVEIRKIAEQITIEVEHAYRIACDLGWLDVDSEYHEIWENYDSVLRDQLSALQYHRLREIHWQGIGPSLAAAPEIVKCLNISDTQLELLRNINREFFDKGKSLAEGKMAASKSLQKPMTQLINQWDAQIREILSKTQQEKLSELKGPKFTGQRAPRPSPPLTQNATGMAGLVTLENVQSDLGLAGDAAKIAEIRNLSENIAREIKQAYRDASEEERKSMDGTYHRIRAAHNDELRRLLTAQQWNRLHQIYLQLRGPSAFTDPEIIRIVGITQEQQSRFNSLLRELLGKQQELLDQYREGRITDREMTIQLGSVATDYVKQVDQTLTRTQHLKLAEMRGPALQGANLPKIDEEPSP